MGIKYPAGPGAILRCDYNKVSTPGDGKAASGVVVSPRLPHRDGLRAVVPLSGDANDLSVHVQRGMGKRDMLATVAFARLDMFQADRNQYGRRKYLQKVSVVDLGRNRDGILFALELGKLTLTGE
jgi:mRNA interferase MazF